MTHRERAERMKAIVDMMIEKNSPAFAAGYLESTVVELLGLLPEDECKAQLQHLEECVGIKR